MATIILAGGLSLRMGQDKARLALNETPLIQLLASRFSGTFGEVIVSTRYDQDLSVERARVTHDLYHGVGPLGGLQAGLTASPDDANFVLACDMPFAEIALAEHLMTLIDSHDAVVPTLSDGIDPLFAVYRKTCLPAIETVLLAGRFRMKDMLDRVSVCYVDESELRVHDPELRSFTNVNTPEDYENAIRMNEEA